MSRLSCRLLLLVLSGFLAACATGRGPVETGTKDTSKSFSTVVVDAGHGGKDNGAYRKFGGAEKTANLDVAKRLSRKLRESDLKIVMTRSTDVLFRWSNGWRSKTSKKILSSSVFILTIRGGAAFTVSKRIIIQRIRPTWRIGSNRS